MTDTRPELRPDFRPEARSAATAADAQDTERLPGWPGGPSPTAADAQDTERLPGWPGGPSRTAADAQDTERLPGWPDARATDRLDALDHPGRLDAGRALDPTLPQVFPRSLVAPEPSAPAVPAQPGAPGAPSPAAPVADQGTAAPAERAPAPAPAPAPLPAPRPAGTAPRARAVESLPAGDLALSLVGLGPVPARHVAVAPRLHDERLRADLPAGVDDHTPLEAALRLRTEVAAERWLARRTRQALDPAARRLTALSARHREVLRRLERSGDEPILDTTGRTVTRDEARATADRLSVAIEESLDSGSEQHRTESPARKRLLLFFVLADFALFAYFMSRVLNVDVFMPATDPIAFTTSIVFALLFTLGVAYALHHFGHAHRAHKDSSGEVVVPEGAVQLRLQLVFVHVLTVLPGILIGVRIVDDALVSGAPLPLALLLGVAIGVVMAGIGHLIYRTELRDGTSATDRLLHLGRHLRRAHRREAALHRELDRIERRALVLSARAERAAARIEQSGDRRANRGPATRTLRYTRSLAGTVHVGAALPEVRPARGGLDEALRQIRDPRVADLGD